MAQIELRGLRKVLAAVLLSFADGFYEFQRAIIIAAAFFLWPGLMARAEIKVLIDYNAEGDPQFKFKNAPQPVKHDAADRAKARFTIVDGESDGNGGNLRRCSTMEDCRKKEDDPGNNFFFAAGSEGGRLQAGPAQFDRGQASQYLFLAYGQPRPASL